MSTPFGPMTLVCNARSGRGTLKTRIAAIEDALRARALEYEIRYTDRPGHATDLTRAALESGVRLVVAVGGDGTINEVVNGMLADDRALVPDAAFGVVAAGSGSDFIRTFGLPASPQGAVLHLDGPESFPIDIGKITYRDGDATAVRYFANVAQVGLGAEVVRRAAGLPRWLGPTMYFFAAWLALARHRDTKATIDLVDRTYEGRMGNTVIANGQYYGGGMKVAPKAAPTDGVFDVQIVHANRREAIAILPKIYKGEHLPHPDITEVKRARLAVETARPTLIEADGEVLGHTPATFEVLRDALRLKV